MRPTGISGFSQTGRPVRILEVFEKGQDADFANVQYLDREGGTAMLHITKIFARPPEKFVLPLQAARRAAA